MHLPSKLLVFLVIAGLLAVGVASIAMHALTAAGDATGPHWTGRGLNGTLVHAVALAPAHPGLALAGTSDGVYRRASESGAWRLVLRSGDVWSIDLSTDGQTAFAGDNNGDVALSRDGGLHWHRVLVAAGGVFAVTTQPGSDQQVLAGGSRGIYLSRDGGRHWVRRLHLPGSAGAAFTWEPRSSAVVFAG